jgi:hypothetical protein
MTRDEYLKRRGEFVPEDPKDIKLIIVAESPTAWELYFYKPDGRVKEPLFAAMMKQLDFKCSKKLDGLQHFKQRGWVLVDATYEPVDGLSDSVRTAIIKRDYELLCCDLRSLTPDRSARLVLIKTNVCQIWNPSSRMNLRCSPSEGNARLCSAGSTASFFGRAISWARCGICGGRSHEPAFRAA